MPDTPELQWAPARTAPLWASDCLSELDPRAAKWEQRTTSSEGHGMGIPMVPDTQPALGCLASQAGSRAEHAGVPVWRDHSGPPAGTESLGHWGCQVRSPPAGAWTGQTKGAAHSTVQLPAWQWGGTLGGHLGLILTPHLQAGQAAQP